MKETIINSFQEYLEYTEKYKNKYLFRGQANIKWNIEPSIFRDDLSLLNEAECIIKELSGSNDGILTSLFKMQHYGRSTRLLDLTISPLSALFFSIDDISQSESDGVIYIIDKSQACNIESDELEIFAENLVKQEEDIKSNYVEKILTRDYVIKYDYNFSYTNSRAILQGGTALLFGFEKIDGRISRKSTRNIDKLIHEKIIIPSRFKKSFCAELQRIGYDRDILYGTFDFQENDELKIERKDIEVNNKYGFYKIIAKYSSNNLKFSRDQFMIIIENIYKKFFVKYGDNARIWLYFLYDEHDECNGNWICRTQWDKTVKYKIIWSKDFFSNRLSEMNEEISRAELISKFTDKVETAIQVYNGIANHINTEIYDMKDFISLLKENKPVIRKTFLEVSDIGLGDINIESYAQAAEIYICGVDTLVNEISLYAERGEKEQLLRYWTEVKFNECKKSWEKLKLERRKVL